MSLSTVGNEREVIVILSKKRTRLPIMSKEQGIHGASFAHNEQPFIDRIVCSIVALIKLVFMENPILSVDVRRCNAHKLILWANN